MCDCALSLLVSVTLIFAIASHAVSLTSAVVKDDACGLLTQADILKATELKVSDGVGGAPVPGVLGRCTWTAGANKVIVTLGDAQHMSLTVSVQEQGGGTSVPGIGSKAVVVKGSGASGGFILSVLDAKGGFGVSVLGPAGTRDHVIALAKVVESHR